MTQPVIRRLGPDDAAEFRALRLAALADAPEAFGFSVAEEEARPLDAVRAQLAAHPSVVFAAEADGALVGIAGFAHNDRVKQRHKGVIWGVFVQPAWRGRGLSRALMQAALAHAREHVAAVHLSVTVGNHVARGLYERLGFTRYGIEPRALCIGGTFHDEELMWLDLCAS